MPDAEKDAALTMTSGQWLDALEHVWNAGYAAAVQESARPRPFTRAPNNPYRRRVTPPEVSGP